MRIGIAVLPCRTPAHNDNWSSAYNQRHTALAPLANECNSDGCLYRARSASGTRAGRRYNTKRFFLTAAAVHTATPGVAALSGAHPG
jgi:hypothetical protein